ncbi:MAG: hypothetical protein CMF67_13355 [Magnetovibrio sp.]|nr:hypothetical protein [Magnetovibrio sp.]
MGSTRFPGKMMADLCGFPIIYWVLKRVSLATTLDQVVLTTSEAERDDPLIGVAKDLGLNTFRFEHEGDVLGRFCGAAKAAGAATVLRVCADNPVVDPEFIDHAVCSFSESEADYAFNHIPRLDNGYPDGLGAEVMCADLLYEIDGLATSEFHREAATSYIWDNLDRYSVLAVDCPAEWHTLGDDIRLDVDWPGDLDRMRALCAGLPMSTSAIEFLARWRHLYGNIQQHLYAERR